MQKFDHDGGYTSILKDRIIIGREVKETDLFDGRKIRNIFGNDVIGTKMYTVYIEEKSEAISGGGDSVVKNVSEKRVEKHAIFIRLPEKKEAKPKLPMMPGQLETKNSKFYILEVSYFNYLNSTVGTIQEKDDPLQIPGGLMTGQVFLIEGMIKQDNICRINLSSEMEYPLVEVVCHPESLEAELILRKESTSNVKRLVCPIKQEKFSLRIEVTKTDFVVQVNEEVVGSLPYNSEPATFLQIQGAGCDFIQIKNSTAKIMASLKSDNCLLDALYNIPCQSDLDIQLMIQEGLLSFFVAFLETNCDDIPVVSAMLSCISEFSARKPIQIPELIDFIPSISNLMRNKNFKCSAGMAAAGLCEAVNNPESLINGFMPQLEEKLKSRDDVTSAVVAIYHILPKATDDQIKAMFSKHNIYQACCDVLEEKNVSEEIMEYTLVIMTKIKEVMGDTFCSVKS